jgi:nicotinate-nucleotide--dimethylbenzimidazole phosphoribosyltransferase
MVLNFCRGGAGINVLGRLVGARVVVADFGVATEYQEPPNVVVERIGHGTQSIARGPAMSREQAVQSVEAGIRLAQREWDTGMDALAAGEMGIGNTTPAAAITAVLTDSPIEQVTGRGAGLTDERLVKKIDTVRRAIAANEPDPADGIDVLAKVGGFEIGGIAGAMLAAAARRCPVLVDGFIATAGAALAVALAPQVRNYLIAGHLSAEGGHRHLLSHLGLEPLVDLGLRLGEGSGAAIGLFLADASVRLLREMATFDEAGVADGAE